MQVLDTIQELTQQNRQARDDELEIRLAAQRIDFDLDQQRAQCAPRRPWNPAPDSPFTVGARELPEIDRAAVSAETLGNGVHHHGAIIVRNFWKPSLAAQYREQIDQVLDEQVRFDAGEATSSWYRPPDVLLNHRFCRYKGMGRQTGSTWAANSPRIMFNLLEEFQRMGLRRAVEEYLGEQSLLSVKKWVVRRVKPLAAPANWHQDGSFMGKDVHSINMWIALSECGPGTSVPGLDLVPGRIDHIVETGTDGAVFDWSVSAKEAARYLAGDEVLQPHFNIGDAIFFDHFNLHRTSSGPAFIEPRYAIECWFLGVSNYPERQVPVLW